MSKPDLLIPAYLRALCEQYGFKPSKSFGQNYLISERPVQAMIAAANLSEGDQVIEIGPGFGVLTFAIAATPGVKITAFEIEQNLKPYWAEHVAARPNIEIVWGDALKQLQTHQLPAKYKVLANLPYQITSHALRTILELRPQPEVVAIMVQAEVADRICAVPGKKRRDSDGEVSLLSMAVQYYGTPRFVTKVSRGSFWPAPKVDSAIIAITNIRARTDSEHFFKILRAGYAHRRKQLWHNLVQGLTVPGEIIKDSLQRVMGNVQVRAEELTITDWERLAADLSTVLPQK